MVIRVGRKSVAHVRITPLAAPEAKGAMGLALVATLPRKMVVKARLYRQRLIQKE